MSYMWTPTLCATATTVGLSAVGYALGRPEQRLPADHSSQMSTQKRKESPQSFPLHSTMPSRLASPAPTAPLSISSLPSTLNSPFDSASPRFSYDGRTSSGKIRRLTDRDATAQQRRTDHERLTTPESEDLGSNFGPRPNLQTRPSWMKRLSSMSTFRSPSPSGSVHPESPFSHSAASAALSHASSSVPTVGPKPKHSLPPDKLMKRSSSIRLASGSSSASRTRSMGRPATSHRHSSVLSSDSMEEADVLSDGLGPSAETFARKANHNETSWKSFFTVRGSRRRPFASEISSDSNSRGIKRILPSERDHPTLITAKSVVTSTLDVDEFPDFDDDSVFFGSRPPSAFGFDSLSLTPGRTSLSTDDVPAEAASPCDAPTEPLEVEPAKRTFSLHDLLSIGPSRKSSIRQSAHARLRKKAGRRVVSDPVSNPRTSTSGERFPMRRDITDPSIFQNEHLESSDSQHGATDPPSRTDALLATSPLTFTSHERSQPSHSDEPTSNVSQPQFLRDLALDVIKNSSIPPSVPIRPPNNSPSALPSGQTSTLVGSESDGRASSSVDGKEKNWIGEPAHDSLGIRGLRTSSTAQSSRLDTMLHQSPPQRSTQIPHSSLQEILPPGMLLVGREMLDRKKSEIVEEDESVGTPHRTVRSDRADDGSPIARRPKPRPAPLSLTLPSSPSDMAKQLSLGTLEYDEQGLEDDEESRWSCFEDDESESNSEQEEWDALEQMATPLSQRRPNPHVVSLRSTSRPATPQRLHPGSLKEARSNIFDWSEQPVDKSPGNRSPPRPRTVHGKKDMDGRGSRTKSRRAPSALHVRSQSVPVVPDLTGKRESLITNKFGTWGVGSKGVSEDWDDDFDFGESAAPAMDGANRDEKRIDSVIVMHIPQVIREQQANVMNNIGLVREFGILIEELKVLRGRAASLGLINPVDDDLWGQIDSMIDLADQEAEDPIGVSKMSPPPSPDFDMAAFEETSEIPTKDRTQHRLSRSLSGKQQTVSTVAPTNSRRNRKSVLPADNNIFSGPTNSASHARNTTPSSIVARPRKDSEAIARSIIEALKRKRPDPSMPLHPVPSSKKVPFDTTTLRHIVPYVNGLVRKVKEQLREAEGLDVSREPSLGQNDSDDHDENKDRITPSGTLLGKLFKGHHRSVTTSPSPSKGGRHSRVNNENKPPTEDDFQNDEELRKQMKMMTVS